MRDVDVSLELISESWQRSSELLAGIAKHIDECSRHCVTSRWLVCSRRAHSYFTLVYLRHISQGS